MVVQPGGQLPSTVSRYQRHPSSPLSKGRLDGFNRRRVAERAKELRRALADPAYKQRLRDSNAWLGGTA